MPSESRDEGLKGEGASAPVATHPLESLPVIGVHPGVGVEAETFEHGKAARLAGRGLREVKPLLCSLAPERLEAILGPLLVEVGEIPGEKAERAAQHRGDFLLSRRWQGEEAALLVPEAIGQEHVQVRRELPEGAPATVGSSYHYKGEEIGEGHMVFTELKAPNSVVIDLEFIKPFAAKNDAIFTFEPDGAGTRATWAMTSANSTLGKCMSVFFDADVMIGGEFEKGLADLKAVAEANKPAQAVGN